MSRAWFAGSGQSASRVSSGRQDLSQYRVYGTNHSSELPYLHEGGQLALVEKILDKLKLTDSRALDKEHKPLIPALGLCSRVERPQRNSSHLLEARFSLVVRQSQAIDLVVHVIGCSPHPWCVSARNQQDEEDKERS